MTARVVSLTPAPDPGDTLLLDGRPHLVLHRLPRLTDAGLIAPPSAPGARRNGHQARRTARRDSGPRPESVRFRRSPRSDLPTVENRT